MRSFAAALSDERPLGPDPSAALNAAGTQVRFSNPNVTLAIENAALSGHAFGTLVTNFAAGEVIDLVYYHGKSVKEVAEIVGIAEATVKTRMFYARKKLADFVAAA